MGDLLIAALMVIVVGGIAVSGYVAPIVDLRRAGRSSFATLRGEYARHLRLVPWAIRVVIRNTWTLRRAGEWRGPVFPQVIFLVLSLAAVIFGIEMLLLGDLGWTDALVAAVGAIVGLGLGLDLVHRTLEHAEPS